MTGFQRMIAIPQEEYTQLTAVQNVRQPLTQQFYKLENEYNNRESIEDPYSRLMKQSETVQEMKELKDKMRQYLTISTPKPYRSRAEALFQSMDNIIRYNERGELLDKNDKPIENSRLEDLIQHAVRDRRRPITPVGWQEFVDILKRHNIPRSFLNRDTLNELAKTSMIPTAKNIPKKFERKSRSRFRSDKLSHSRDYAYSKETAKRKRRKSMRYPSTEFLKNF